MKNLNSPCSAFICNAGIAGLLLVCSFSSVVKASFTEDDLIADVPILGKIRGVQQPTAGPSIRQYIQFLGMKYAVAPAGNKRFLPSKRYNDKLNQTGDEFYASTNGPPCVQPFFEGSEDCLALNVYTPKPYNGNDSELLPVIFFIHGGAFTAGQSNFYNGKRLLNKDVVLVSLNYRLGVLGFFSLNSEEAPGNAGIYDILNGLLWTRDYIKYFGGNPDKITIAGQSAGSVAVTHLMASPLSKDLFHGAIASSGSALVEWGTTADPITDSLKIANRSGCYNGNYTQKPSQSEISEIVICMQNANTTTLVNALYDYQISERKEGRLGFSAVSPTLQTFESTSFPKILPKHPKEVFENKEQANVPLLMGTTRHDGSYVLGVYYKRYLAENNYVNATDSDQEFMTKDAVPQILNALGIPNEYGVYDSIAKVYLGDTRKSGNFWDMYPGFIDLFSVFFFKASSYQTALYHSQVNSQTFWYSFDYQGKQTLFSILFQFDPPPINSGITHSDDLLYVFEMLALNAEDQTVSDRMVEYWTNFATFGNPTPTPAQPTWHPLNIDQAMFLSIDKDSTELQHFDDMWNEIGWEVIPSTDTPSTSTSTEPSTSPEITDPTTTDTTPSTTDASTTDASTDSSARGVHVASFELFTVVLLIVHVFMYSMS